MWKPMILAIAAVVALGYPSSPVRAGNDKDLNLVPTHGELANTRVYADSYALLVGVNKYPNLPSQVQLHYAVADAMSMRDMLIKYYGFPSDHIKMLLNGDATKQNIDDALADYSDDKKYHTDDRIFVYFSGHGQTVSLPNGGEMGFLIPSNANVEMDRIENAAPYLKSCVKMEDVWGFLELTPAKHVLLVADACYSGLLVQSRALSIAPGALAAMASRRALQVMTAGEKGETSTELDDLGHGAFTYKLMEELKARAAEGPGTVFTSSELYASVERSVSNLTDGRQDPQFGNYHTEGNFLFITTKQQKVPDIAQVAVNDDPTPAPEVTPQPQPDPQPDNEDINPEPAPVPKPQVKPAVKPKSDSSTTPKHVAHNEAATQQLRDVIQNAGPPPYDDAKAAKITADINAALAAGADPNGTFDEGSGPEPILLAAVSYECVPAVELLLKAGANPNVSRAGGDTPLSISKEEANIVTDLLEKYGATH